MVTTALLFAAGFQLSQAPLSPTDRLQRDLMVAASDLGSQSWNRHADQVRAIVRSDFTGPVLVNAARFPTDVTVTVSDIDRKTCVEASARARRFEGRVVVALEGYKSTSDCRASNEMVWHIMP